MQSQTTSLVPVPHPQRHWQSGNKQTRKKSTVLPSAPPAHSADPTRPGEAEFPRLCPSASVSVGSGTSSLHRVPKRTSPVISWPQPPSCSPQAKPEMSGRILQGKGSLASAHRWSNEGVGEKHSEQLWHEPINNSDLITINITLQDLFSSVALDLDTQILTFSLAEKLSLL